jgi:glycosyltransferase involved in cell wall biosynthesis
LWAHLETALAGRMARRPVILDLHDIVDEGAGRTVLGAAARLATVTLANSAATASTVPGSAAKVQVVHPGVDVNRFHPGATDPRIRAELTADPSAALVAIIGRIDPNKGVDVLVDAISRLSPQVGKPHLVVIGREHVGAPEHGPALRRHATDLLGDRVRFLAPREDIPEVLRAVDVLVNASRHEPFGRTLLEAQACGVPVVGTDAGGAPELIRDGETGLLVRPFDVSALERALTRLLSDATLQRRLSSAANEQARSCFSLQSQARAAASVYRSAVRGRG